MHFDCCAETSTIANFKILERETLTFKMSNKISSSCRAHSKFTVTCCYCLLACVLI